MNVENHMLYHNLKLTPALHRLSRVFRKKSLQLFFYTLSSLVLVLSSVEPAGAILVDHALVEKGITQYDSRVGDICKDTGTGTSGGDGDVDRFLQVLADQESGGDPQAQNSVSSASGKYQYIDSTWRSRVSGGSAIYPPGARYAHAKDAPEAVQDAVAYIEYSKKFVDFNSEIFKLAVSHFYPIANENPSLLDVTPPGNVITPREYAESIIRKITEGVGTNIPLKYREAPQFDQYNTAGPTTDPNNPAPDPATTPSQDTEQPRDKGKVFLDPGHGAAVAEYTDSITGLRDRETANRPESGDVLQVARRVKAKLEADGYSVALSRTDNQTEVNKRKRVNEAQRMGADIAVSIHTTPGTAVNDVWSQKVGTYREYNSTRVTYQSADTAEKSNEYADAIAAARRDTENRSVSRDLNNTHQTESFNRDGVPSKGNTSLVQLWSKEVPWVYSEYALGNASGLNEESTQEYVEGLVDGIERAVNNDGTEDEITDPACINEDGTTGDVPSGDLSQMVLAYAWPTYHSKPYLTKKPAYAAAVRKAQSQGKYVGGCSGVDCGAFVTILLNNSGFEPKYNYSGRGGATATQQEWAEANWKKLGTGSSVDVGNLQPGDVAINGGDHTFVYVGTIPGFHSKIASASLCGRAPMAGSESLTDPSMTWYRKR